MHVLFAKQNDIEKVVPYLLRSVHRLVCIVFLPVQNANKTGNYAFQEMNIAHLLGKKNIINSKSAKLCKGYVTSVEISRLPCVGFCYSGWWFQLNRKIWVKNGKSSPE